MRIHVTGAIGFVGTWLQRELAGADHEVVCAPGPETLDIVDRAALAAWLADGTDAVMHLAGMAYAPDARMDPAEAFRVNVGGTIALFEALRSLGLRPPVLVTGSSEVYGTPAPADLPLRETAPLGALAPYGVSKVAQEAVAVEAGVRHGFPVVVTRAFNHSGPGQRPVFVLPALARRVEAVRRGLLPAITAGNVDVRRDIGDVRDVVRAYRLLIEHVAADRDAPPLVVNVATGRADPIRSHIESLCAMAGIPADITIDASLVRTDDAQEIRGDASLLTELTGWRPAITMDRTLRDLLAEAREEAATGDAAWVADFG